MKPTLTRNSKGFTVIELLFVIVLLASATVIFFIQKNNLQVGARDDQRKVAINAMYYSLEKVYYPAHNFYPVSISSTVLPSVDPALFIDPSGNKFGDNKSDYHYQATNCTNNECKSYTLRASLENEADYVKTNTNN